MQIWDDVISEQEKMIFQKAGFGARQGFGKCPALLIIDVKYNFVGDRPEPILQSIERFPKSCGDRGWIAVGKIKELLATARRNRIAVFYTGGGLRADGLDVGKWATKNIRTLEPPGLAGNIGTEIVGDIAPLPSEIVISKKKPSAFFGTPLISYLTALHIDTLIITGTTTSGCVRATAIDSFSYNLNTVVVEECVFDRGITSHKVTLFDLSAKYADVVKLREVQEYFDKIGEGKGVDEVPSNRF